MYMTAAAGNNRACFSYEWLTYCYRTMLTRRSLETDFEKIVHAILCLFSGDLLTLPHTPFLPYLILPSFLPPFLPGLPSFLTLC